MNKLRKFILSLILFFYLSSNFTLAVQASGSLPFWNNGNDLIIDRLPGDYDENSNVFGRVDDTIGVNPTLGEYRYPTIHQGKFSGSARTNDNISFNVEGRGTTLAYQEQPFYHLVPLPKKGTARNIIESSKVTSPIIQNVYGGNPEYVLSMSQVYRPIGKDGKRFGTYYYIRDIAKWSGGTADNTDGTFDGVNPTRLYYVRTSWPDISKFKVNQSSVKLGQPLTFSFDGFEYVSMNRNRVDYTITIKKDNKSVKTLTGSTKSDKGIKNPSKPLEVEAGKYQVVNTASWSPTEEGQYTAVLKIEDEVKRYISLGVNISVSSDGGGIEPKPEPDPKENIPPTAKVSTESIYYWPENVNISTVSHDPDGEIVSESTLVSGKTSSNTWKSPRITERTTHEVRYIVTDDGGATAEAQTNFDILPTIPKAETEIKGTLKQNRAVTIDAKASDRVSPVHVAPIDYSKTKWSIKPLSEGLEATDIKIRLNSDHSYRQLLFKKPGKYELNLTVTNKYGEESEVHTRILDIRPDEKPIARFTVDKSIYTRSGLDGKQATVKLTDSSVSIDGDIIDQRIWYVEFDANNDGLFGTAADGGKQVISNKNETSVTYKTKHVGHYRLSLEVKEKFGDPTYDEFIEPEEYLRDNSDVLDSENRVDEHMKIENFNIPNLEKGIRVDNIPPIIDFGIKRMNSIELVLDFGGMDQATQQHKTGSRPGGGVNNGGGGGNYDHYYYQIDQNYKNALTAYAGTLEADLRSKGLDAAVVVNNSYSYKPDTDGTCVRDIPVWGWRDYGSYQYSSYTGRTPYSGDWEVTSSSSKDYYRKETTTVRGGGSPSGSGWYWIDGGVNTTTGEQWDTYEREVYSYTEYNASLRKWQSDMRFVVTGYTSEGCSSTEQVDTTDFTQEFSNYGYSNTKYKYYFRMDKNKWTWTNNTTKRNLVVNKIKSNDINFWSNADNSLRVDAQSLINSTGVEGNYTQYSTEYLQSNIQRVRDYMLNKFMIEEDPESFTIVLGDELNYTTEYSDFESDPELQREWKFVHDPEHINGRLIDNQPAGPIAQSGLYISAPMQLPEVGTYTVTLRAKDNPLSDVGNDARFTKYRKWSDEEIVREYKVNVHRRPIADFTFAVSAGSLELSLDPMPSYDPDHQFNRSDKGIVEHVWEKYVVDGVEHQGKPPGTLEPMKDYHVTLRVKDIDGAFGYVTKLISTKNVNLKPIALFDAPSIVLAGSSLNIIDRSYDPNGDPLTNYQFSIKRASDRVVVWTGQSFPTSFSNIGLGTGKYIMGLTVDDIPKYPPSLRSDLYERTIEVIDNRPPISCFELSRTPLTTTSISCEDGMTSPHTLFVDETVIYTDKSSDPDDHELINYSWKIEKLDDQNKVVNTWNLGYQPIDFTPYGVGKFRVTQLVFDNPPAPLHSLSGKITKVYNVIKGPQAPYAMFEYNPLLPISGQTIQLKDQSWDEDGNVVQWQWKIESPNGNVTTQTDKNPTIPNAVVGTYKVTLHVWDDTSPTQLRSKVPAYKEIIVSSAAPNKPPVAQFVWDPFEPFLGDIIKLNPDGSYDLDGTIVSYQWQIRSKEGALSNSSNKYPSLTAVSEYYDVTLTVRDDRGASASHSERINVNIAGLKAFVTHTSEWNQKWIDKGYPSDVNIFHAGEKFLIKLTSTPAQRVWGSVHFGGKVGKVDIPSSKFKLVNTSEFEYAWEAELWREDFIHIEEGQYMFDFHSAHPVENPRVEATANYLVEIQGNVYSELDFHRNH